MEAVFSMVWKIYGKQPGDPTEDLNVNLAIWGMFTKTTLQAVHLRKDYDTNLHHAKNHIWDSLGQLFGEIKRLICELSEILGPKTPEIVGLKNILSRRLNMKIDKLIERKSISDHYFQSLCLLRLSTLDGRNEK